MDGRGSIGVEEVCDAIRSAESVVENRQLPNCRLLRTEPSPVWSFDALQWVSG